MCGNAGNEEDERCQVIFPLSASLKLFQLVVCDTEIEGLPFLLPEAWWYGCCVSLLPAFSSSLPCLYHLPCLTSCVISEESFQSFSPDRHVTDRYCLPKLPVCAAFSFSFVRKEVTECHAMRECQEAFFSHSVQNYQSQCNTSQAQCSAELPRNKSNVPAQARPCVYVITNRGVLFPPKEVLPLSETMRNVKVLSLSSNFYTE